MDKPAAVIVGLDSMQGLQVARILAARSVPVYGIAKNAESHACKTRVCRDILVTDTGGEALVGTLAELSRRLGEKAVLIPCQDKNVLVISRCRDELESGYHIRLPRPEVVEELSDKGGFADVATRLGIPIPASFRVASPEDLREVMEQVPFPAVIKPQFRSREWLRHTKAKAIRVETPDELARAYDTVGGWVDTLVVQQWIEGGDSDLYSFNGYFDADSRPLATFIARKIRQYPPEIGQSCLGEEVRADVVLETSLELFGAVGMVGLAYLEMKRDRRTGRFYAIEPNIGRPTGRSPIAEAGGVELHYTAYCDAAGLPLPSARQQTYGHAKWIHLLRDVQSAWHYYRKGELTVREWWRSIRGPRVYAVWSWRDPLPFLAGAWGAVSRRPGRSDTIEV